MYLKSTEVHGMKTISFFHDQLSLAVRKRYFDDDNKMINHIYKNLCDHYKLNADPTGELLWNTKDEDALTELPYYYTVAFNYLGLKETLTNINFIRARCELGYYSLEGLIRDYQFCFDYYKRPENHDSFRQMLVVNHVAYNQFFDVLL